MTWHYINSNQQLFNISQLDALRYYVSPLDTLYIRETKVNDSGQYVCTASNIAGSTTASSFLTVVDSPLLNGEL